MKHINQVILEGSIRRITIDDPGLLIILDVNGVMIEVYLPPVFKSMPLDRWNSMRVVGYLKRSKDGKGILVAAEYVEGHEDGKGIFVAAEYVEGHPNLDDDCDSIGTED